MNLKNLKYVAVVMGKVWVLNHIEGKGYIFRRLDSPDFGLDGFHTTEQACTQSAVNYGAIVINVETTTVCSQTAIHVGNTTLTT